MSKVKDIVLYKQAQETMQSGILWDYENNAIIHTCLIDDKTLTLCGVRVRGPEYGWRKLKKELVATCPTCKEEFEKFKHKVATCAVVTSS